MGTALDVQEVDAGAGVRRGGGVQSNEEGRRTRIGAADERERRVDHVEHLREKRNVLQPLAVVGEHEQFLLSAARLVRATLCQQPRACEGALSEEHV